MTITALDRARIPDLSATTINRIAMVAHEANRAYCDSIGDRSQPNWHEAPQWQRKSARDGVLFHIQSLVRGITPDPSASHDNWLAGKREEGWKYGPIKDPEKKEHPCFLPYDELPPEQRMKDYLFASIVKAFFKCWRCEKS